jgi:hypothetical protein
MASDYPHEDPFHGLFSPPAPQRPASPSTFLPRMSASPWSASSPYSLDRNSLTLPPLLGNFDDEPLMPMRSQRSTPNSHSHTQSHLRPPPPPPPRTHSTTHQSRRHAQIYDISSDSPDLFFNFDNSPIRTPQSPVSRTSSVVDLTISSPDEMPSSRKRKTSTAGGARAEHKKQKATTPDIEHKTSHELSENGPHSPSPQFEEVDMTEVDNDEKHEEFRRKQQEDLIKKQNQERADKPVKLADFQCIICLDNPTDLTVTHCGMCSLSPDMLHMLTLSGHLFCSLCLHEALHTGNQKKNCPVCRQVISTTKKPSKDGEPAKQPLKGVYALEMKLMTSRRKGKLPATDR